MNITIDGYIIVIEKIYSGIYLSSVFATKTLAPGSPSYFSKDAFQVSKVSY